MKIKSRDGLKMVSEAERGIVIHSAIIDINESTEPISRELEDPDVDTNESSLASPHNVHAFDANTMTSCVFAEFPVNNKMAATTPSSSIDVTTTPLRRSKPTAIVHPMMRQDRLSVPATSSLISSPRLRTEHVTFATTLVPPPSSRRSINCPLIAQQRSSGPADHGGCAFSGSPSPSGRVPDTNAENSLESDGNELSGSDAELSPTLSICRLTDGAASPFSQTCRPIVITERDGNTPIGWNRERSLNQTVRRTSTVQLVSFCEESSSSAGMQRNCSDENRSDFPSCEEEKEEEERLESLRRKSERETLMASCNFYYGAMTNAEAKAKLKHSEVGSYLLRDSSDKQFLFSISVKTSRGTTSIRVAPSNGCDSCSQCLAAPPPSIAADNIRAPPPSTIDLDNDATVSPYFISDAFYPTRTPATSSPSSPKTEERSTHTRPRRRMMRLDCDPSQEAQMPHFPDVLSLIRYCVRIGQDETMRNKCMFLERSGRMDTPILLKKSVTK